MSFITSTPERSFLFLRRLRRRKPRNVVLSFRRLERRFLQERPHLLTCIMTELKPRNPYLRERLSMMDLLALTRWISSFLCLKYNLPFYKTYYLNYQMYCTDFSKAPLLKPTGRNLGHVFNSWCGYTQSVPKIILNKNNKEIKVFFVDSQAIWSKEKREA
jgi:hypothetical protein